MSRKLKDGTKLPKTVRIGAVTYTVTTQPEKVMDSYAAADQTGLGWSHSYEATIEILDSMSDTVARTVFVHEVLHQVWRTAQTDALVFDRLTRADDAEELVIRALETGLTSFIRDNPEAIAWLASDG